MENDQLVKGPVCNNISVLGHFDGLALLVLLVAYLVEDSQMKTCFLNAWEECLQQLDDIVLHKVAVQLLLFHPDSRCQGHLLHETLGFSMALEYS